MGPITSPIKNHPLPVRFRRIAIKPQAKPNAAPIMSQIA
jgi:hypothetical protein